MRFLIIEDEWFIATLIEQTLITGGMAVVGMAGSLERALSMLAEQAPDAAILDANLGGETAEAVAAALEARAIPFIVVSGYSREQRSGRLAAAPFLGKPFSPDQLLEAARRLSAA